MPPTTSIAGLERQFGACLDDALRACSQMRDARHTSQRLDALVRRLDRDVLHASMLPCSSLSRSLCLAWLLGDAARSVEQSLDSGAPVIEMNLSSKRNATGPGSQPDSSHEVVEPLVSMHSVRLKVAATNADIQHSPPAYVQFCERGQVLILILDGPDALSRMDSDWLAEILQLFDVVWPWVAAQDTGGLGPATSAITNDLSALTEAACLPPLVLTPEARHVKLPVLSQGAGPLRDQVQLLRRLRTLEAVLSNEAICRSQHVDELSLRVAALDELQKGRKAGQKNAVETQQGFASEYLSRRMKEIEERVVARNEQLAQAKGVFPISMQNLVEHIRFEMLDHSVVEGEHNYQLMAGQLSELERSLSKQLFDQLREDVFQISMQFNEFMPTYFRAVKLSSGGNPDAAVAPPPEDSIWSRLKGMIQVNRESPVRIPRLTIGTLLGKTRQRVFMVLMFGMILGRLGIEFLPDKPAKWLQDTLAIGGASLFFVCVGSVIVDHRKDTRKLKQTALERIREAIVGDATKVFDAVQKEKLRLIKSYLDQTQKKLEKTVSTTFLTAREWQQNLQSLESDRLTGRKAALGMEAAELRQGIDELAKFQKRVTDLAAQVTKNVREQSPREVIFVPNHEPHVTTPSSIHRVSDPPVRGSRERQWSPIPNTSPDTQPHPEPPTTESNAYSNTTSGEELERFKLPVEPLRLSPAERRRRRLNGDKPD